MHIFPDKQWVICLGVIVPEILEKYDNKILKIEYAYSKLNRKKEYFESAEIDFEQYSRFLVYISEIDELKEVWQEYDNSEKPIKIVLVSVDDQRTASRVKPIVGSNGWVWDVVMDKNGDLARIYHITMPPQWVAVNSFGKIIYRSKVTNGTLDSAIYFDELITEMNKTN